MATSHDHYRAESHHGHQYKPLKTDHFYFVQKAATEDTVIPIQKKLNSGKKTNSMIVPILYCVTD